MNKTWGQHWSTLAFGWSHRGQGLSMLFMSRSILDTPPALSHGPHIRFWRPCQAPFSCLTSSHSAGPFLPRWAVSHRQRLLELNSSLEFKLHRLQFIRLLAGGPEKQLEALSYARHFQPFAHVHQRGTCPGPGVAPTTCMPLAALPHMLYGMPPRPPKKKRLASTGTEGQEPETRSLMQLEGWGRN